MLFLSKITLLLAVTTVPAIVSIPVSEDDLDVKTPFSMDIKDITVNSSSGSAEVWGIIKSNISALQCGVPYPKPAPTHFTNCIDFCEEVCNNNNAIEVGATNYKSCRCTVFNNVVAHAGCCTEEFGLALGDDSYTCEDDICGTCWGDSICFQISFHPNHTETEHTNQNHPEHEPQQMNQSPIVPEQPSQNNTKPESTKPASEEIKDEDEEVVAEVSSVATGNGIQNDLFLFSLTAAIIFSQSS